MNTEDDIPGPTGIVLIGSSDEEEEFHDDIELFPLHNEKNKRRISPDTSDIQTMSPKYRKIGWDEMHSRPANVFLSSISFLLTSKELDSIHSSVEKLRIDKVGDSGGKARIQASADIFRASFERKNFDELIEMPKQPSQPFVDDNEIDDIGDPAAPSTQQMLLDSVLNSILDDFSFWKRKYPQKKAPMYLRLLLRTVKRAKASGKSMLSSKKNLRFFRNVGNVADLTYAQSIRKVQAFHGAPDTQDMRDSDIKSRPTTLPLFPNIGRAGNLKDLFHPSVIPKWSHAQLEAWKRRRTNPNLYYYRFPDPSCRSERMRGGKWTREEHEIFLKQYEWFKENKWRVGSGWGIFSKALKNRVGYQCSNYYRVLLASGVLVDPTYIRDPETGRMRQLRRDLYDPNEVEITSANCTLSDEWSTEGVKAFEREVDETVAAVFPSDRYATATSPILRNMETEEARSIKPRKWAAADVHRHTESRPKGKRMAMGHQDEDSFINDSDIEEDFNKYDGAMGEEEDEYEFFDDLPYDPTFGNSTRTVMQTKSKELSERSLAEKEARVRAFVERMRRVNKNGLKPNGPWKEGAVLQGLRRRKIQVVERLERNSLRYPVNSGILPQSRHRDRSRGGTGSGYRIPDIEINGSSNSRFQKTKHPPNGNILFKNRNRVSMKQSTLSFAEDVGRSRESQDRFQETKRKLLNSIVRNIDINGYKSAQKYESVKLKKLLPLNEHSDGVDDVDDVSVFSQLGLVLAICKGFRDKRNGIDMQIGRFEELSQITSKITYILEGAHANNFEDPLDDRSIDRLKQVLMSVAPLSYEVGIQKMPMHAWLKAQILVRVRILEWIATDSFKRREESQVEEAENLKPFRIDKYISMMLVDLLSLFEEDALLFKYPTTLALVTKTPNFRSSERDMEQKLRNTNIFHSLIAYLAEFSSAHGISFWKLFNDCIYSFDDQRIEFIELAWHYLFMISPLLASQSNWEIVNYFVKSSPIANTNFEEDYMKELGNCDQQDGNSTIPAAKQEKGAGKLVIGLRYESTLFGDVENQKKWYCRKIAQRVFVLATTWDSQDEELIITFWNFILREKFAFSTHEVPNVFLTDWKRTVRDTVHSENFFIIFIKLFMCYCSTLSVAEVLKMSSNIMFSLPRKQIQMDDGSSRMDLSRLRNMCTVVVCLALYVPKTQAKALIGRMNSLITPSSKLVEAKMTLCRSLYLLGKFFTSREDKLDSSSISMIVSTFCKHFFSALDSAMKNRRWIDDIEIGFKWISELIMSEIPDETNARQCSGLDSSAGILHSLRDASSSFHLIIKSVSDTILALIFLPRNALPLNIAKQGLFLVKAILAVVRWKRDNLYKLQVDYAGKKKELDSIVIPTSHANEEEEEQDDFYETISPEDLIELHNYDRVIKELRKALSDEMKEIVESVYGKFFSQVRNYISSLTSVKDSDTLDELLDVSAELTQVLIWEKKTRLVGEMVGLYIGQDLWIQNNSNHVPISYVAKIISLESRYMVEKFENEILCIFAASLLTSNRTNELIRYLRYYWMNSYFAGISLDDEYSVEKLVEIAKTFFTNTFRHLISDGERNMTHIAKKRFFSTAFLKIPQILLKNHDESTVDKYIQYLYRILGYIFLKHSEDLYQLDLWEILFNSYFKSSPAPVQKSTVLYSTYFFPIFMLGISKLEFVYSEKVKGILRAIFQIYLESVSGQANMQHIEINKVDGFSVVLTASAESIRHNKRMYKCIREYRNILADFRGMESYIQFRKLILYNYLPYYLRLPPIYPSHIRSVIVTLTILTKYVDFISSAGSKRGFQAISNILDDMEILLDPLVSCLINCSISNLSADIVCEIVSLSNRIENLKDGRDRDLILRNEATSLDKYTHILVRSILDYLYAIFKAEFTHKNAIDSTRNGLFQQFSETNSMIIRSLRESNEKGNPFTGYGVDIAGSTSSGSSASPFIQYRGLLHYVNRDVNQLKEKFVSRVLRLFSSLFHKGGTDRQVSVMELVNHQIYCLFHQELWHSALMFLSRMKYPICEFWKCFCLYKLGKFNAIATILESLRSDINTGLAATTLLYVQAKEDGGDYEIALNLGRDLEVAESKSTFLGMRAAIICCIYLDEIELARQFSVPLSKSSIEKIEEIHCSNGWINLSENLPQLAGEEFTNALGENASCLEAAYGKSVCMLMESRYSRSSLKYLQDLVQNNPDFVAASTLLSVASPPKYDFVIENAKSNLDPTKAPFALCNRIIHQISVTGGDPDVLTHLLDDLIGSILKNHSSVFVHSCASMILHFVGVYHCNGSVNKDATNILNKMIVCYSIAMNLSQDEKICIGYADCYCYSGQYQNSETLYNEVLKMDNLSPYVELRAKLGLAWCKFSVGDIDDALDVLDVVSVHESLQYHEFISMSSLFLRGICYERKGERMKMLGILIELLTEALNFIKKEDLIYPRVTSIVEFGDKDFPNITGFAISLCEFAMKYAIDANDTIGFPHTYRFEIDEDFPDVERGYENIARKVSEILLELISGGVPGIGLGKGLYLLAESLLFLGKCSQAIDYATVLLNLYPNGQDNYLLAAEIYMRQEDTANSMKLLEEAINRDYSIGEDVRYKRLLSIDHLLAKRNVNAINESKLGILKITNKNRHMKATLSFLVKGSEEPSFKTSFPELDNYELEILFRFITVFALALCNANRYKEATGFMKRAVSLFKDTVGETRLRLVLTKIVTESGNSVDIKEVRAILADIDPEKPCYVRGKAAVAELAYLRDNNKEDYLSIYERLVEERPCILAYVLLGNAIQKLQKPIEAVEKYKKGLEIEPANPDIITKIVNTLISTHNLQLPIDFYERSLKEHPVDPFLRITYAKLLLSLENGQAAVRILQAGVTASMEKTQTIQLLRERVEMLLLLADAHNMLGEKIFRKESYLEALTTQKEIIALCTSFPSALYDKITESKRAADIAHNLAEENSGQSRDKYLTDALKLYPAHIPSIIAFTLMASQEDDAEGTIRYYRTLMELGHPNSEVAIELARIYLKKQKNISAAIEVYSALLDVEPSNMEVLARIIGLFQISNRLENASTYLANASNDILALKGEDQDKTAGLNYCKGLYKSYRHNMEEAVVHFSHSRISQKWRIRSTLATVEIYLGIPQGSLWEGWTVKKEHIVSAEALMSRLPMRSNFRKRWATFLKIWNTFMDLAREETEEKELEKVVKSLVQITATDMSVPALLALAAAYYKQNLVSKAKNVLKRLIRLKPTEDEQFLEYSYLFLAFININAGNYDTSMELLKHTLTINASSIKAYEYLGITKELEGDYEESAVFFSRAWDLTERKVPDIGYKLAIVYSECGKYVDSREVCHLVATGFPQYIPHLKPVLAKNGQMLRL